MLSFRADIGRERLAGMLFLIHGQAATYQIGWTTPTGRETNAHHLMLWRGIEELQQRGVRLLDLGGVNTQRSAGMARFKIATGGAVLQLAGSYLL
jgi:lipid II:glycine glycyltransferase (peptidoglycan interpeptide bridge formation enzyme)